MTRTRWWLSAHLTGLKDDKIRASYVLPPKHCDVDDDDGADTDADLIHIPVAAETMLRDTYGLFSIFLPVRG